MFCSNSFSTWRAKEKSRALRACLARLRGNVALGWSGWNVVASLPQGLDTRVGERGRSLVNAAILNDVVPMVIGTRMRSRGTHAFYRVHLTASHRPRARAR